MNIELRYMKAKLGSYEQRYININLVLDGVPEADRENVKEVNVISNNVIPLSTDDIARCHRLGPRHMGQVTRQN